jgi:hypothetical protein
MQLSDFEANLVVHRPAPPSQRFKATSPRLGRELHEQTKSGYKYNCIEEETGVTYVVILPIRFASSDAQLRAAILPRQVRWAMPMTSGKAYGVTKILRSSGIGARPEAATPSPHRI